MTKSNGKSGMSGNTTDLRRVAVFSPIDRIKAPLLVLMSLLLIAFPCLAQQDWIRTGTGLGVEKVRLAVSDFKPSTPDPKNSDLLKAFNDTLWNDLDNAGIFDLVSKSFNPLEVPGQPSEIKFEVWSSPPANASMLAFGNLGVGGNSVTVQGWLYDVKNPTSMDYDGSNQHPITHLGSISLSPRISPDGSRLAFSSLTKTGWEIMMYSLELGRSVSFPRFGGTNLSPAWSPDGTKLAFSGSRTGESEIYVVDSSGGNPKRLTAGKGPDVSPTWNRKTGAQLAFVSGRTGLPQIYTMEADGTNVQRMTDQGYAVSPTWSPNGQFLAFSWMRKYGPGMPGANDLYLMDIASKQWVQLSHDGGRNDFPSWSPDGRHIVFQSSRSGSEQIWTMLADGTKVQQLTFTGNNTQPNWSWK